MPAWTPVVDVSHHQGVIDFNVMRSRGVVGLIIRATNGTLNDRRTAVYYRDALAAGFPADQIGFYSFLNPKRADARTSAEHTARLIRGLTGRTDVLYMLDIESYRNEHPNPGTVTLRRAAFAAYIREHWAAFVAAMPGCRVIAYSNRAFWNGPEGPNDDELAGDIEWIVPRYPVHSVDGYDRVGRPGAPPTWDEWAFARATGPFPPEGATWAGWQFSADFNGQGPVYGCQSSALDLNIVDAAAWARWTSTTPVDRPEVITPPPPPTPEEDDMIVKTLWQPTGSEDVYCIEDGVQISPAIRQAWRADDRVHLIEVYGDPHPEARASIEHAAGQRPSELPNLELTWK